MGNHMGGHLPRCDRLIDAPPEQFRVLQQARHLALEILTGSEAALPGGLQQDFVGSVVAHGVGDGISGLARREHLAAMFIGRARSEFHTVEELGLKQHHDQHLAQAFGISGGADRLFREIEIFRHLRFRRLTPQDVLKLPGDGGSHLIVGRLRLLEDDVLELHRHHAWHELVLRVGEIIRVHFAVFDTRRANLAVGNVFRVGQHHQQRPAIERADVVVPYTRGIRQGKGVGDALELRIALPTLESEHIAHPRIENLRADQPAPRGCGGGILDGAAEELFVIHVVPVGRIAQFVLQLRSIVGVQFRPKP